MVVIGLVGHVIDSPYLGDEFVNQHTGVKNSLKLTWTLKIGLNAPKGNFIGSIHWNFQGRFVSFREG